MLGLNLKFSYTCQFPALWTNRPIVASWWGCTDRQRDLVTCVLLFFKNKKSRLKIGFVSSGITLIPNIMKIYFIKSHSGADSQLGLFQTGIQHVAKWQISAG
jgi:hypothetical protein